MIQLIKIFVITLSLLFLIACSSHTQNTNVKSYDLDNVSPTVTKEEVGFMQSIYNDFIDNEWEPTISKNESVREKYMKKDGNSTEMKYVEDNSNAFTLQEYVDKAAAYSGEKINDENSSNVHRLEQMPVIGK